MDNLYREPAVVSAATWTGLENEARGSFRRLTVRRVR